MEKTAQEVFNEIQTTIEKLRAQLDELEERLEEMVEKTPDQVGGDEAVVVPVKVDVAETKDLEEQGDDWEAPAESEAPEYEPVVIPDPDRESPEPVEPEPVDLSIDMEALGAKTVPDAKNYQWMIDLPGSPVANVISAISLNDRVLFINTLFKEDPSLFQQTISAFNGMESINEAISYVIANFPDWNLNSEVVYRLMMAVRRKLS